MQTVKKFIFFVGVVVFLGFGAFAFTKYYSWIFSHTVEGQIFQVERVTQPTMVVGSAVVASPAAMFSFAVAIRDKDGKIFTASSEDRQWAVAQKGLCVEAKFYPYPPWDLDKGGTYMNARLIGLKDCPQGLSPLPEAAPTESLAPASEVAPTATQAQ